MRDRWVRQPYETPLVRVLSKELVTEFEDARNGFRQLVATSPINAYTIREGWRMYEAVDAAISGAKGLPKTPHPNIREVLKSLTPPYSSSIDPYVVELAHQQFRLRTFDASDGKVGFLLSELQGEALRKALRFCEAMYSIGWYAGDLQTKFPNNR